MREMTKKELRMLGKDLNKAKMQVLKKHGFTNEEIAKIMNVPVSIVEHETNS